MLTTKLSNGTVHKLPADLKRAIAASPAARATWEDITPLARSEWICWTISCKKAATRQQHVVRVPQDLARGKRRPCCWLGCPHR